LLEGPIILTIRGEKKVESKEEDKSKNYHVSERSYARMLLPAVKGFQAPAGRSSQDPGTMS